MDDSIDYDAIHQKIIEKLEHQPDPFLLTSEDMKSFNVDEGKFMLLDEDLE